MDLRKTIADFEQKAADYTEAANSLRALLAHETGSAPSPVRVAATAANTSGTATSKRGRKPGRQSGKRGAVSEETKAKIAAAMRAKHQARKAAAAKG